MVAFVAFLLGPFALHLFVGRHTAPRPASEASAELRIITPHNQDVRRVFERAFVDWYARRYGAAVAIKFLSPGGSSDLSRFLREQYEGYRRGDGSLPPPAEVHVDIEVVWGGGDYVFERELKPYLLPLAVSAGLLRDAFPRPDLAGVPLLDPESRKAGAREGPRWVGVALSSFGVVYSPELYDALALPYPRTWSDLGRPELHDLVALADPTRSGSVALMYMMVLQRAMVSAEEASTNGPGRGASREEALGRGFREGMAELTRIAANARYFTNSGSVPAQDVGNAAAAAGVAIDFYARTLQRQLGKRRLTFVAPPASTAITPDPVGVLYGTTGPQLTLATRFVEFLLSKAGQELWILRADRSPYIDRELRRMPVRRDVYESQEDWSFRADPFAEAGGFNLRPALMSNLSVLRQIWAAAWIDAGSALRRAYSAVLRVPRAPRREALLRRLVHLPIERAEVDAERLQGAGGAGHRLRAAKSRLGWASRFRGHYERIYREASGE